MMRTSKVRDGVGADLQGDGLTRDRVLSFAIRLLDLGSTRATQGRVEDAVLQLSRAPAASAGQAPAG
jgi:hypothetical protein